MKKVISVENLKDCLMFLFCAGGGWAVPILLDVFGIIKVGEGLAIVLIFTVSIGLRFLCEYLEGLIAYLMKDKEWKKQRHLVNWDREVNHFMLAAARGEAGNEKCCKLIDKLFKDSYLNFEEKKVFYDRFCVIWTEYGLFKGIYTVPPEIQKKWKKAQADDKLRQLKKDF